MNLHSSLALPFCRSLIRHNKILIFNQRPSSIDMNNTSQPVYQPRHWTSIHQLLHSPKPVRRNGRGNLIFIKLFVLVVILLTITSCAPDPSTPQSITDEIIIGITQTPTSRPTATATDPAPEPTGTIDQTTLPPTSTPPVPTTAIPTQITTTEQISTATPQPTLGPDDWKSLPIIPEPSENIIEIFQHGLAAGNNPNAFSKIGDCGSTPTWFLGDFDRDPTFYDLGEYTALEPIIPVFQGSYGRTSLAARSGFNASSLFVPLWADREFCNADETPLACEYRVHKPAFAFIMLGTNDIYHPDDFEPQMRNIIEFSIQNGVVPILSTKADNMEGDGSVNATIARLAIEYDIPLWNFWLAVQPLPDQGLQSDKAHLTWARNFFNDPVAMQKAWPVRNLNALQVLQVIWQTVSAQN